MKRLFSLLAAASLIVFAGCEQNKGTSGGPGVTKDKTTQKTVGQAEETFSIKPPMTSTTIKQGETKEVAVSIKRGKNFTESVALSFDNLPKGVTIDPAKATVDGSKDEAKVSVKADDNADLGEHTIKVTGHPSSGPDATNELKIKVDKK